MSAKLPPEEDSAADPSTTDKKLNFPPKTLSDPKRLGEIARIAKRFLQDTRFDPSEDEEALLEAEFKEMERVNAENPLPDELSCLEALSEQYSLELARIEKELELLKKKKSGKKRTKGQPPSPVPSTVKAPKDWLTAPIWTPGIQRPGRAVDVFDHRTGQINTWTLGVQKPLPKVKKGRIAKPHAIPEITIQHIKVAFAVLSFWKGKNPVPMSVNELALRVANSRGGRYSRDLLQKLYDLRDFWVSVKNPEGRTDYFPILQKIHLHEDAPRKAHVPNSQEELWLDEIELAPEFANLLADYGRSMDLNFDTLREIKSGIVQSIYLFLPSRAVHHSQDNPFEITTERLWQDLELAPTSKGRRKDALSKNKPSILEQLDGLKLLSGRLRVSLQETVDHSDWNSGFPEFDIKSLGSCF